jgi:hypothetical protein
MKIRPFEIGDIYKIRRMAAGLPSNCLADFTNPLFCIREVVEDDGRVAVAGFLKLTGELFLFVDHEHETPQKRWEALQMLAAHGLNKAAQIGLEDATAWIPPDLEKSFAPRLIDLGFTPSQWHSYTAKLQ